MQHQEIAPPAVLREVVQDFWYVCRDAGEHPMSPEVAPDGHAEIIFYFGGPCSVATPTGWQWLPSPFLVGLLRQPAHFRAESRPYLLIINFFPRLWLHPTTNLAGLAQELGYADQSHLGREFRRYSGTTPAAFARCAARWQQAAGSDFVAFLLA